jgi:hypothetical protein
VNDLAALAARPRLRGRRHRHAPLLPAVHDFDADERQRWSGSPGCGPRRSEDVVGQTANIRALPSSSGPSLASCREA